MAAVEEGLSPPDPKLGLVIEGRYRLDERLAAGGMGVVYRAERLGIGKTVAIKFLHETFAVVPDLVKRFEREAAVMSRLSHPNLVSVIDYGLTEGSPYLVMEFHAGQSLAQILLQGPLGPRRAAWVAKQILAGLRHAHEQGIIHRDLKPDNVLLLSGMHGDFVKVLDFGLAKLMQGDADDATQLTHAGFAMGTPGYMSPEQAQGTKVDLRTDIYSLGVILYQMVVGKKPFVAESPIALLRMHMDDPPVPPRRAAPASLCSSELEAAILRALEKAPSKRWGTALEFHAALEATPEGRATDVPLIETSMHELPASRSSVAIESASPPRVPIASDLGMREDEASTRQAATRALAAPARSVVVRRGGFWGKLALLGLCVGIVSWLWARRHPDQAKMVGQKLAEAGRVVAGDAAQGQVPGQGGGKSQTKPQGASGDQEPAAHPAVAKPEPTKPEPTKPEPTKPEPTKPEPTKPEPTKPEPTKPVPSGPSGQPPAGPLVATSERPGGGPPHATLPPAQEAPDGGLPWAPPGVPAMPQAGAPTPDGGDEENDDPDEEPVFPPDTPGAKLEQEAGKQPPPAHLPPPDSHPGPVASSSSHPPAPGIGLPKPPPAPAKPPSIDQARRMLDSGDTDGAIQTLYLVRRKTPKSAAVALLLGHAYFKKDWRTDGLHQYANAMTYSSAAKYNKTLQRNVVSALNGTTYPLARGVIKKWLGKSVIPELHQAARSSKNTPLVRQRATKLAAQLTHPPPRKRWYQFWKKR